MECELSAIYGFPVHTLPGAVKVSLLLNKAKASATKEIMHRSSNAPLNPTSIFNLVYAYTGDADQAYDSAMKSIETRLGKNISIDDEDMGFVKIYNSIKGNSKK